MIIARLAGGLGNQLFIYATARALAARQSTELLLDVRSGFKYDPFHRVFMLHHFDIKYTPTCKWDPLTRPDRMGWFLTAGLRRLDRCLRVPKRLRFYIH